ncbi:hypothetical protein V6N13_088743 [Hibiscus sabdariffa]|uniref:Uncharacterized protein n=1 Tax=Hibiscus sabdariffa TaxID=183260 RepID=A0ABR2G0F6_9ROSI
MALSPALPLALLVSSSNPRLPKKQRRHNEDLPDHTYSLNGNPVSGMECDFQTFVKTPASYKDIVTGSGGSQSGPKSIDLDDDDIELLEKDVALVP